MVTVVVLVTTACNKSTPTATQNPPPSDPLITPTAELQGQAELSEPQGHPEETPSSSTAVPPELPQRPSRFDALRDSRGRGFVPLDSPAFIKGHEASFLGDDELVLGYESQGEARAYPVKMMRFHHIANDTVNGEPILITY